MKTQGLALLIAAMIWLLQPSLSRADMDPDQNVPAERTIATDTDIQYRHIWICDLNNKDLRGRKLSGYDFSGRSFIHADLSGADLHGAVLLTRIFGSQT